ncbi:hypothetical protein [Chitinimonas sp. BJB300]|uniref:hypothetical protein n=1 Tax=Chitinimonas sp. BJB300 TaxID=1559339 RepID=UPI000C0F56E0|nr:hypothetical protein [Chitinimonas sp. BJB300]PHV11543.1 hypothetical protein CSQ89_10370 [Chitinimonas sp. BJB300]TSJ87251.1 hypothetical protein FG002_014805 [Chitinimonas sp. BJB300]
MANPSDFYVGVVDFFAILLPGAIATAILGPRMGHLVLGQLVASPTTEAGTWAVFLTSAYFLGHLIFLVGSYIDRAYNRLREQLSPYGNESAYQCATRIRDTMVDEAERTALNTFQWARAVLIAKCPAAAEDVHRLEADSKFFRSLLVVCILAAVVFFSTGMVWEACMALVLGPPCFARYYERRLKSTTQAYIHIVTLHHLGCLR